MDKGETLCVAYGQLTAVLVKAVQEQQEIIEDQKVKIEAQEARIDTLEAQAKRIDKLENLLLGLTNTE